MADYLSISATFLDSQFHGRGDGGEPEWPPSPLRLMQAIVAANADRIGADSPLDHALAWLERQPPPMILAPRCEYGAAYCLSVPNNAMDLVGKAWAKGNYFGTGDSSPATHRTMKTVRPLRMLDADTVHYLWPIDGSTSREVVEALIDAARRIIALGWGVDLVIGHGEQLESASLADRAREYECWSATPSAAPATLRVPQSGSFDALQERHAAFIQRMGDEGFMPVEPLTSFDMISYRRPTDPVGRPFAVFELRHDDGEFCRYPQSKLIHIAGMTRHLAGQAMQQSPPPGVDDDWVGRYILGHRPQGVTDHRQISYLPLPSIGHEHADQIVRRVMIAAPIGDDRCLEALARRLAGRQLIPENKDTFGEAGPPTLIRVPHDKVARAYTRPAHRWASVTPVVLPGHDDKKPAKTRRLIKTALAQSGIEQQCEFEWATFSRFRKSFSAHKYGKGGKPTGYHRPDHLSSQTLVHLTLRFDDGLNVPGPIVTGAGRHCGLGLMAALPTETGD